MCELGAAVDAGSFIGVALDHDGPTPLCSCDVDDVGKVVFAGSVVVSDLVKPPEKVASSDGHHSRVAQAHGPLLLSRILEFDHLRDVIALAKDDPAVLERIRGR